jgi:hypothetical protein
MRRLCSTRGQATTEYVALVALVAVMLALAAGLTSGGIGGQVLAGIQRGLCAVAVAGCPRPEPRRADLAACPVERATRSEDLATTIAVLQLGASGALTAVRLSDGRVTITLTHGSKAGAAAEFGARLRVGARTLGGRVGAVAGVGWTSGRSWTFTDAAAARRFVATYGRKATIGGRLLDSVRSRCSLLCDALGWEPHAELPVPDEEYAEAGPTVALTAALGLPPSVSAGAHAKALLGRRERRDGARAWYLRLDGAVTAALGLSNAMLGAGVDSGGEAVASYELDARGRPRELRIMSARAARGDATLTRKVGAGRASLAAGAAAVVEVEATLDLREAANRRAAADLLGALTDPGAAATLPLRARTVGERLARRAQIDRRTFAVTRTGTGFGAGVALGARLDAGVERTTDDLRLLRAETRLPGLPFLPRDDCRPA